MKRYVAEPGSEAVRDAMEQSDAWFIGRHGYTETFRAVALAGGPKVAKEFASEWPAFGVVEVDQALVEHAAELALEHGLRSLDSLHFAAALVLPAKELTFASWDQRLLEVARSVGLAILPSVLD